MKRHFEKCLKWYLLGYIATYKIPNFFLEEWYGLELKTNWGTVIQILIYFILIYILFKIPESN